MASVYIYPSQWPANSAISDCDVDSKRCFVLEFGANLDASDIVPGTPYTGGPLNVLFSGVKWIRKGGNIAVDTVLKLRSMGIDARLTIAGIKDLPDDVKNYSFVQCVDFLNKNDPVSYQKYIDCWKKVICLYFQLKLNVLELFFVKPLDSVFPLIHFDRGNRELCD